MILGVYGAGGLGREVYELARDVNRASGDAPPYDGFFFIDDAKTTESLYGVTILTFEDFRRACDPSASRVAIGVGEPALRARLREKTASAGFELQTLIHPSAKVFDNARIGSGCMIGYGCFIADSACLERNVYVQMMVLVGHDTRVGDDCVLGPSVNFSGMCAVGAGSYIGMGACVREGVAIGAESVVGMGSVVLKDVPDGTVALGNPAKVTRKNERGVFSGR